MTDKELNGKLSKIGYSPLWLDSGVLTIDYLIAQERAFDQSDDKNKEHYRYHAFRDYLSSKGTLSDLEFDNYLELTFIDSDSVMAGSAAVDLFTKVELTETQFQKLCDTIRHFGDWTEKVVWRQILIRKLRNGILTGDLFEECLANGDKEVHEFIIDIADESHLRTLAEKGINKKIRKIASERLRAMTEDGVSR